MSDKVKNRFDLEQELLECWKVVEDIKMFSGRDAKPEDWQALSTYYEYKFNTLWDTFENMVHDRKM